MPAGVVVGQCPACWVNHRADAGIAVVIDGQRVAIHVRDGRQISVAASEPKSVDRVVRGCQDWVAVSAVVEFKRVQNANRRGVTAVRVFRERVSKAIIPVDREVAAGVRAKVAEVAGRPFVAPSDIVRSLAVVV